jgi:hypothetical protein
MYKIEDEGMDLIIELFKNSDTVDDDMLAWKRFAHGITIFLMRLNLIIGYSGFAGCEEFMNGLIYEKACYCTKCDDYDVSAISTIEKSRKNDLKLKIPN